MSNVQKFEEVKARFDRAKTDFTRVETLLAEKRKEYKKVEEELKAMGIDPKNLEEVKAKLSSDIFAGYGKIEELLAQAEEGLKKVRK